MFGTKRTYRPSTQLFDFIRNLGESTSRQDEQEIVRREMDRMKVEFPKIDLKPDAQREFILKVLYCDMLGFDVSPYYNTAVKMTQQNNLYNKYAGYNAVSILLHENHELMVMVVNSFRKELVDKSHFLSIAAALTSVCRVISNESITVLKPFIPDLLAFNLPLVRRKCALFVHRIYLRNPDEVPNVVEITKTLICDVDPSVMAAALPLCTAITRRNVGLFRYSVDTFRKIFVQVLDNRLGKAYIYKGIPAPWIQLNLLKFFGVLGEGDQKTSTQIYPMIEHVLKSQPLSSDIGISIIYEAIRTLSMLYPNTQLLQAASDVVAPLVSSPINFHRYIGISSLSYLCSVDPSSIAKYALVLLGCLDDKDEEIRGLTLSLLVKLCNASNVEAVVERLLKTLEEKKQMPLSPLDAMKGETQLNEKGEGEKDSDEEKRTRPKTLLVSLYSTHTSDTHRLALMSNISSLAERLSPSNVWFVKTIARLLVAGGDEVPSATADNLLSLIGEGTGDETGEEMTSPEERDPDVDATYENPSELGGLALTQWVQAKFGLGGDREMRRYAVTIFRRIARRKLLPYLLLRVVCWVIGEFGGDVPYENEYLTYKERMELKKQKKEEKKKRMEEGGEEEEEEEDPVEKTIKTFFDIFDEDEDIDLEEDEDTSSTEQSPSHFNLDELYKQLPSQPAGAMDDEIICSLIERHPNMTSLDRQTTFTALAKIAARKSLQAIPNVNEHVKSLVKKYCTSHDVIVQELCCSLYSLFESNEKYAVSEGAVVEESPLGYAFPIGGASEDIEVDEGLTFLNDIINDMNQNEMNGEMKFYVPPDDRTFEHLTLALDTDLAAAAAAAAEGMEGDMNMNGDIKIAMLPDGILNLPLENQRTASGTPGLQRGRQPGPSNSSQLNLNAYLTPEESMAQAQKAVPVSLTQTPGVEGNGTPGLAPPPQPQLEQFSQLNMGDAPRKWGKKTVEEEVTPTPEQEGENQEQAMGNLVQPPVPPPSQEYGNNPPYPTGRGRGQPIPKVNAAEEKAKRQKKLQQAELLFGGDLLGASPAGKPGGIVSTASPRPTGGAVGSRTKMIRARQAAAAAAAAASSKQQQEEEDEDDMFAGMEIEDNEEGGQSGDGNLIDLNLGSSSAPSGSPNQPSKAAASEEDILNMFGGSPSSSTPTNVPTGPSETSLFQSFISAINQKRGLGSTEPLPERPVRALESTGTEPCFVSYAVAEANNRLYVGIFVTNTGAGPNGTADANITVACPPKAPVQPVPLQQFLKSDLIAPADPKTFNPTPGGMSTSASSVCSPHSAIGFIVNCACKRPIAPTSTIASYGLVSAPGQVPTIPLSFSFGFKLVNAPITDETQSLFAVQCPVHCLISPLKLVTPQFGAAWKARTVERVLSAPYTAVERCMARFGLGTASPSGLTPAQASQVFGYIGFHVVAVKSNEIILSSDVVGAGPSMGSNDPTSEVTVLLHCRLVPAGRKVDMKVHSFSGALSELGVQIVKEYLGV